MRGAACAATLVHAKREAASAPDTRRATATLAMAACFIALVALVLITAARFLHRDAYVATYEWFNLPIAATGAAQFQSFAVDLDLRIDHFSIAECGVILATAFLVLAWSRSGARVCGGVVVCNESTPGYLSD